MSIPMKSQGHIPSHPPLVPDPDFIPNPHYDPRYDNIHFDPRYNRAPEPHEARRVEDAWQDHADPEQQTLWQLAETPGHILRRTNTAHVLLYHQHVEQMLELRAVQAQLDALTRNYEILAGRAPQPAWDLISPALTVLTKLIYSLDDEVLIDACWAISYLSDGTNDKIQVVVESGIPALRSVGNIVTGDELQTKVLIASGVLPALLSLLSSPKDYQEGGLLGHLQRGFWGLQEPAQIRYLVAQGCIKPLCDLLTMVDNKVIQVALDGLDNVLKIGEMDKVAAGLGNTRCSLKRPHENLDIYKRAFNIMDKYFLDEGDLDVVISTPAVDSTGSFAFQSNADAPEGGFSFG
ncbi:armadillo-type protein [Mycena leptocephala]|nr:armadillo-type protein [Mycena leptocephala]